MGFLYDYHVLLTLGFVKGTNASVLMFKIFFKSFKSTLIASQEFNPVPYVLTHLFVSNLIFSVIGIRID